MSNEWMFAFFCTGVITVILGVYNLCKYNEMQQYGKRVKANIIDVKYHRGGRSRYYANTLEYMVEGEQVTTVYATRWQLKGDTAEIAYLPEDPVKVMMVEELTETPHNKKNNAIWLISFGVICLLVGIAGAASK